MVTILLAVYNGERFLREQIDSLLTQTVKDIKIIIRDDGSKDGSRAIIERFCSEYPQKIFEIKGAPTGSAAANFSELLKCCDDDYIMFCDQDDVWLCDKVEKTLDAMKKAEAHHPDVPILVHSDLSVVDGNLSVISQSFFDYQRVYQNKISFSRLLVQNYVTGCTVMINRKLAHLCGHMPRECVMHDWWLALIAVAFGKIVCIDEQLMLYRQHSDNQVGAKASNTIAYIKRKIQAFDTLKKNYNATYIQARAFKNLFYDKLNPKNREILDAYCCMPQKNKLQRIQLMRKHDFRKGTILRILGQYIVM